MAVDLGIAVQGGAPSNRYVWYGVALLSAVNAVNYIDRMALAVLAPLIKADLKLSDTQLGLLTGLAFALFYAICGVPIARWADRGVRRNIIALALTTWSGMTAISGAAQNFWHLLLARVGVGAGEAGSFAPGASMLCDYVPLARRAGVFAVHLFGNNAGLLVGMALAGWLAEVLGWRWAFVALGLPGLVLAVMVRMTLREPVRGACDAAGSSHPRTPFFQTALSLWRCRTYRLLVLFFAGSGFVQFGLIQWWPSLYARTAGLELSSIGLYLGVAIGAGGGIGLLVGGLLAGRVAIHDATRPLRIGAVTTFLIIPSALASLLVSSTTASIAFIALTGFLWSVASGPILAAQYSVVNATMRATSGAVSNFFMSALGFGLGPLCVGVASDLLSNSLGADALRYALMVPIGVVPMMVFALLGAAKTLPADLRGLEARAETSPSNVIQSLAVSKPSAGEIVYSRTSCDL